MRNAPPVQHPVGFFHGGRRALWGLWLMSLSVGLMLLWDTPLWRWAVVVIGLLAVITAWGLCQYLRRVCLVSGHLQWEDGQWHYLDQGHARPMRQLALLWDGGDRIWLRWCMAEGDRLCWREAWVLQSDAPASWHFFRCALAAHSGKNFTRPTHSA